MRCSYLGVVNEGLRVAWRGKALIFALSLDTGLLWGSDDLVCLSVSVCLSRCFHCETCWRHVEGTITKE